MIYGNITLNYETGSLKTTKSKQQIIRHYIGTNISDCFPLGKPSTNIRCKVFATSEEEKILLESLFHADIERELYFNTHYYKRVVTGDSFNSDCIVQKDGYWEINVEFIALDPLPYDKVTGEALY